MSSNGRVVFLGVPEVREIEYWRDEPEVERESGKVAALGEEGSVESTGTSDN